MLDYITTLRALRSIAFQARTQPEAIDVKSAERLEKNYLASKSNSVQ